MVVVQRYNEEDNEVLWSILFVLTCLIIYFLKYTIFYTLKWKKKKILEEKYIHLHTEFFYNNLYLIQ